MFFRQHITYIVEFHCCQLFLDNKSVNVQSNITCSGKKDPSRAINCNDNSLNLWIRSLLFCRLLECIQEKVVVFTFHVLVLFPWAFVIAKNSFWDKQPFEWRRLFVVVVAAVLIYSLLLERECVLGKMF